MLLNDTLIIISLVLLAVVGLACLYVINRSITAAEKRRKADSITM